jgi:RecA-family ATPase
MKDLIMDIKKEADQQARKVKSNKQSSLFMVKTANKWIEQAKTRPIPNMLFSEFWFEGELCILFADTNLGKSILAVQIGNSISKGEAIPSFRLETPKQKVLYFDFELSEKQFENRYSIDYQKHYKFDNYFERVEIDSDAEIPEHSSYEEYLNASLEMAIIDSQAKILIIDNLTFLKTETEKAKDALPLMKHLKSLKKKYGLSILALAHTPKRDLSKPISRNDLSGSKMLINFCDSSFSIGESHTDKNLRYLKQIKQRNTENIYDTDNVCVCQIDKPSNFLQFEFVNFGKEREHLKQPSERDNENLTKKIVDLKEQGLSLREIGLQLGISHMKVSRLLKDCNKV